MNKNTSKIHATIVLYNNIPVLFEKAIESFLDTQLDVKLYLIDNSETDELKYLADLDERIEYIFNGKNLGFGVAHNIALQKSIDDAVPYHLVLNPDVYYDKGVLEELLEYMENNPDVANVMPQVYYPDGSLQRLCKKLPAPIELVVRRFVPTSTKLVQTLNKQYELHDFGYDKELNVPYLSGCFMLLRVNALKEVGLFDENIFMYMEDVDLSRRLHMKYKTIFYPHVSITHVHAKESYKRKALLWEHIKSTIYYFNKWGWLFDSGRKKINKELLERIKEL
ncbi:glycosyltransferase family 2 protein [Sulfurimonas sp. NW7]|uniref:glycosyltransferase family 2 protein n=1 Tax=Sulfurimonas sp. NW7 TaxID=2922727 RepID=UPI003DA8F8D4